MYFSITIYSQLVQVDESASVRETQQTFLEMIICLKEYNKCAYKIIIRIISSTTYYTCLNKWPSFSMRDTILWMRCNWWFLCHSRTTAQTPRIAELKDDCSSPFSCSSQACFSSALHPAFALLLLLVVDAGLQHILKGYCKVLAHSPRALQPVPPKWTFTELTEWMLATISLFF